MKHFRILLIIFCITFTVSACSSNSDFGNGKTQLENQGYTNIQNTGYSWFCCGEDDNFSTGFKAKSKNGKEVKGCFCSAVGKGITTRFK